MSLNTVMLMGVITEAGVKLSYKERGCELRWTLLVEEAGKGGDSFKTFVPCINFAKGENRLVEAAAQQERA